jgi:hypothetical protein
MTKLVAVQKCAACDSPLVPPELATGVTVPNGTDRVCVKCGRASDDSPSTPPCPMCKGPSAKVIDMPGEPVIWFTCDGCGNSWCVARPQWPFKAAAATQTTPDGQPR